MKSATVRKLELPQEMLHTTGVDSEGQLGLFYCAILSLLLGTHAASPDIPRSALALHVTYKNRKGQSFAQL